MNHAECVKRFAERTISKRTGRVEWRAGNVFCEGKAVYSYGHHFPMAYYREEWKDGARFVLNGDRYSSSTSKHQADVRRFCKGPTVSFTAMRAARLNPETAILVDYTDGTSIDVDKVRAVGQGPWSMVRHGTGEPFTAPRVGEWNQNRWEESANTETLRRGEWHILGASLWRNPETGETWLASTDEGSYFISRLPGKPRNIEGAFLSLIPQQVRKEREEGQDVKRQGEWFFCPSGLTDKGLAYVVGITQKALRVRITRGALKSERQASGGNEHVCSQLTYKGRTYARGVVYHRNPEYRWTDFGGVKHVERGRSTGEHRALHLGTEWHAVYRNTETESHSAGGRVD
ncbi:MAG: hypothetical protein WC565_07250 [Parcubacteria group bacterium]|jgi:hypothetical protein